MPPLNLFGGKSRKRIKKDKKKENQKNKNEKKKINKFDMNKLPSYQIRFQESHNILTIWDTNGRVLII